MGCLCVLCVVMGLICGGREGPCPTEDSLGLSPAHVHRLHYGLRECHKVSHGFEPRSLDSESRVLTVTPRDQLHLMQPRWHNAAQPCTGPATSTCRAWRPRRHGPCPPAGWDACRGWMQMAGPWPTAVAAWPAGRLRSRSCGHGPVNQSGRHGAGTRLETRPSGPEQGRSHADLSHDRWIQSPEC